MPQKLPYIIFISIWFFGHTIYSQCKAVIKSKNTACDGTGITFTIVDSTKKYTCTWDFGDIYSGASNTSFDTSVTHIFSSDGTFFVKLTIVDSSGCTDSVIKKITILPKPKPQFTFTNNCSGIFTSFINASTSSASDTINAYFWKFGDGNTSSLKNSKNKYSATGTYSVCLITKTAFGCVDSLKKNVLINNKPNAKIDTNKICKGSLVNFTGNSQTGATNYSWDFGDGSNSASLTATHSYTIGGWKKPIFTVYFSTGNCTINTDSILVKQAPQADFIIANPTQCYKGNNVCIELKNSIKGIKSRSILFDDGTLENNLPKNDSIVCHKYTNPAGGDYSITVEYVDSFNCISTQTKTKIVKIHPEINADFKVIVGKGCFTNKISIQNLSNQSPPAIVKYTWDFGDGNTNNSNWSNFNYTYTKNGSFKIKLIIKNNLGCVDSVYSSQNITNTTFVIDAKDTSIGGICRNNNNWKFKQTIINNATILWNTGAGVSLNSFNSNFTYTLPGKYFPSVTITKNGCDTTIYLTPIEVHGPRAIIGGVINQFQCQSHDTVKATNSSILYKNNKCNYLWDAGDFGANNCIYNTQKNSNLNNNCRYSSDSSNFKHFYPKNTENCYYIKLKITDSILGCTDSAQVAVPIMRPVASGIQFSYMQSPCPQSTSVTSNIMLAKPTCARSSYWVMWDSFQARKTGNFNANWVPTSVHTYPYFPYSGDSLGRVTTGLIIENGTDTNGTICRDTAWYHHVFLVRKVNPIFNSTYKTNKLYCKNSDFIFTFIDSTLDSIKYVTWDFGDGTIINSNDLLYQKHTFKQSGVYKVIAKIEHESGCIGVDSITHYIGIAQQINILDSNLCIKNYVKIAQNNHYFKDYSLANWYWNDSNKAANGKERVRFDLDDGNGFRYLGGSPNITYNSVGNYKIKMESRDSIGCLDTITAAITIHASSIFANFIKPADTLICPQNVQLLSTSTVVDSATMEQATGDKVIKYNWNFGAGYANSFVKNPLRYYPSGNYAIKLTVENIFGCVDSITKKLVVIGPIANYKFISDSVGCEPLKITFQNTSKNANNFTWNFNNITNTILSTKKDTNVTFSYTKYGKYYPSLTAFGTFTSAGITRNCSTTFPDTNILFKKEITVHETPKPTFNYNTNCATKITKFTNNTVTNTAIISGYSWDFGDGSTSNLQNPSHNYNDTGTYKVVFKIYTDKGCEDSIVKKIVVSPLPIANFGFTKVCHQNTTLFFDSSFAYNDRIYLWKWNFGNTKTSVLKNPTQLYTQDTIYTVKLVVTNIAGCSDSISKNVIVYSKPKPNFLIPNACEKSVVSITNLSTSKQSINSTKWSFGDGTFSDSSKPNKLYLTSQNFTIKLVLKTIYNCKDSISKLVTIYPKPVAKFVSNKYSSCEKNNAFIFSDSSKIKSGTKSFTLYFGDYDSTKISPAAHSYSKFGTYNATIIVKSNFNCKDTYSKNISVFTMPKANFSVNKSAQCFRGNKFIFTDLGSIVTGNYTRYWQLHNGANYSDSIFNYSYIDSGRKKITLALVSNNNCTDTVSKIIQTYPMPIANFSINNSKQCIKNNSFVFTNNSVISWGTMSNNWNFGDTTNSSLVSPAHTYNYYGNKTVTLIQKSAYNCADTIQKNISIYTMPKANFTINKTQQCFKYNQYIFTDSSNIVNGNYTRTWQLHNGNTYTDSTVTYHYVDSGLRKAMLITNSNNGCKDTMIKNIQTYPMPIPNFSINKTQQCLRYNIFNFTNNSNISWGNLSYSWDFGDTTQSNVISPSKRYINYGNKQVQLIATSNKNCADTTQKTIILYPMPKAKFSINNNTQCAKNNVFTFSNTSNIPSGSLTYNWNFGDGNLSTNINPNHSYNKYGNYAVLLIANSNNNCLDSFTDNVVVHPMPIVGFTINNANQCFKNQNYIFTDTSNIALGSLNRYWNLGDGTKTNIKTVIKTYANDTNYTIKLTQISNQNCSDSISKNITVYPNPKVSFIVNDSDQCLRANNFIFTNKSTIKYGVNNYLWKMGDGRNYVTSNTTHAYKMHSNNLVVLIATSNYNCVDSFLKNTIVYPMPKANFTINDTDQCLFQNAFQFTNSSTIAYGNLTYSWTFGNGNLSANLHTNQIYNADGLYTVKLVVNSQFGCYDTASKWALVDPMPVVRMGVNKDSQCINQQNFIFYDSSFIKLGTITRNWKFTNTNFSTLKNPTFNFKSDTNYVVVLIQQSNKNCVDSAKKTITVHSKPNVSFIVNDSDQCLRQNQYVFTNNSTIKIGRLRYFWNYGNNTFDTIKNGQVKYPNWGNSIVKLYANSNFNCIDSVKKQIRISPMPNPIFNINDTGQCINNQLFILKRNSNIADKQTFGVWQTGNGIFINKDSLAITYPKDSIYSITLIETSTEGCVDSITHKINVYPKPLVNFMINDTLQCLFQNDFKFTNESKIKYGNLIYFWNLGNGISKTTTDVQHKYAIDTNYTIVLKAKSNLGCIDTFAKKILVASMPKPAFAINDNTQCFNEQQFKFTNLSNIKNGIFWSKWDFGNAQKDTNKNVNYKYPKIGNYSVKLLLISNYNCIDSSIKNVQINPNGKSSFVTNDSDQCINQQQFIFTNTSTVSVGKIILLNWDLGNGIIANSNTTKTSYATSGMYRVTLITTTDSNCNDTFSNVIRVYPKPNSKFLVNDSAQCLNQNNYQFLDNSTDSFGVNNYIWNINNETFIKTQNANYIFNKFGTKTITLIVKSNRGCADTNMRTVFVKPMPDARFETIKNYYCEQTGPYNFTPNVPGGNYIGKNCWNNLYNPTILWKDTIKYIITVNACTDSSEQFTNVYPLPKVNLGKDTILCKNEILDLNVAFWQSKYLWSDGIKTNEYRIKKPGKYWVSITNICGEAHDTITVDFRKINCRFFLPNSFSPNNDGKNDLFKPVIFNVDELEFVVLDRWGAIIFKGNKNSTGWDGTYLGKMVPSGVYIVQATYKYSTSYRQFIETENGVVHLIR